MALTTEEFEAAAADEREKRLTLIRAMRAKLAQALHAIKPGKMPPRDIIAGIRLVNDQSRIEFRPGVALADEPTAATDDPTDPLHGFRVIRPAG